MVRGPKTVSRHDLRCRKGLPGGLEFKVSEDIERSRVKALQNAVLAAAAAVAAARRWPSLYTIHP